MEANEKTLRIVKLVTAVVLVVCMAVAGTLC